MAKLPPLRALQALEAFGRLGSVTGAAADLGVTIGAVSQQIQKAEEAVGLKLVERRGRNIVLTARGQQYYQDLGLAFDMLRAAHDRLGRARLDRTLTISCLPSLASKWIGAQLLDWQARHPGAKVRLIGDDAEPVFGKDQADFRVSYGTLIDRFERRAELFTDWVVPACAPAMLARSQISKPADILDAPLLGIEWDQEQGFAPSWSAWAAQIGAVYRRREGEVTFSLSSAALDAAINGRGFVLAQLSMVADDLASGRLVAPFDLRMKLAQPYALAFDAAALDKPFAPELRNWLLQIGRKQNRLSAPPAE